MKTEAEINDELNALQKEIDVLNREMKRFPVYSPERTHLLSERADAFARQRALQWVLRPSGKVLAVCAGGSGYVDA